MTLPGGRGTVCGARSSGGRPAGLQLPITRLEIRAWTSLGLERPCPARRLAPAVTRKEPTFPLCAQRRRHAAAKPPATDRKRGGGDVGFNSTFRGERQPAGPPRGKGSGDSDQQLGAGAGGNPLPAADGGETSKLPPRWEHPQSSHTPEANPAPGQDSSFRRGETGSSAEARGGDFRPHPRWRPGGAQGRFRVGKKVIGRGRSLLSPSSDPTRTGKSASSRRFAASALLCLRSSAEGVP